MKVLLIVPLCIAFVVIAAYGILISADISTANILLISSTLAAFVVWPFIIYRNYFMVTIPPAKVLLEGNEVIEGEIVDY